MGRRGAPTKHRAAARAVAAVLATGAAGIWAAGGGSGPLGVAAPPDAGAATAPVLKLVWRKSVSEAQSNAIALSSPNVAALAGGPAVVVGDRSGAVYAYHLATGSPVSGWPKRVGAPVTSTPSVVDLPGTAQDTVLVGTGNSSSPCVGGYQWLYPNGNQLLVHAKNPSTDPACAANGVRASIAVGELQGQAAAVAGSMGQMTYAMNAKSRAVLPGFPWFQADSNFATPAIADLYGTGQNEIVEGGASTAGVAYGRTYTNGGHVRILSQTGALRCVLTTDESVNSSPAVGRFFAGTGIGIVAGTGSTYPSASQHDQVIAVNTSCHEVWARTLAGTTGYQSPALADVLGNGRLQVVETTLEGGIYALTGANGATRWHTQLAHEIIGSPVTVALGSGHQDVVVATINGFDILTGTDGAVLVATRTTQYGYQNAPLVTEDPNGTIGLTFAGYWPNGSVVSHYEIATSSGTEVDATGTWPQFHHDPQLTGNVDAPIVALDHFAGASRVQGATADATAAAELARRFPPGTRCPGTSSTRPVVLATDAGYADALSSAPLARALGTGTLLTPTASVSAPTLSALRQEGITRVVIVGGRYVVSTHVATQLAHTAAYSCGGGTQISTHLSVTRIWGQTEYTTAEKIARTAGSHGVGSLDLAGAYAANGGRGAYNATTGLSSAPPATAGALATAIVATGRGFQDAMSASTLAYAERLPILLTTPHGVSTQVSAALTQLHVHQVILMGGPLAVSDTVVRQLEGLGVSVLRVAGADFTGTAVELARLETAAPPAGAGWAGTGDVTVARGDFYTDGLAGAVVAAGGPTSAAPEPLLLTRSPEWTGRPLGALLRSAGTAGLGGTVVRTFTVLGGPLAITQTTVDAMGADL